MSSGCVKDAANNKHHDVPMSKTQNDNLAGTALKRTPCQPSRWTALLFPQAINLMTSRACQRVGTGGVRRKVAVKMAVAVKMVVATVVLPQKAWGCDARGVEKSSSRKGSDSP